MARVLIHTFAIKGVTKKHSRASTAFIRIGRKCQAVVIRDDDILKARLVTSPVEESDAPIEFHILPLTPNSFSLTGKLYVFFKERDEYNHLVCIIRNPYKASLDPNLNPNFVTLHEGLLITGYVVSRDKKRYFEYKDVIAFSENGEHINEGLRR